jgi:hypothetical protein
VLIKRRPHWQLLLNLAIMFNKNHNMFRNEKRKHSKNIRNLKKSSRKKSKIKYRVRKTRKVRRKVKMT